jgi:hypothetical protein
MDNSMSDTLSNEELAALVYALEALCDEEEFYRFTSAYQDAALDMLTKLTVLYRKRELHYSMFEKELECE